MPRIVKSLCVLAAALILAAGLGACSPLAVINTLNVDSDARVTRDIPYAPDARHMLDIYAPRAARSAPVVVFFYGGSWNSGSRSDYAFVGHALASRGMVAVVADYRLYPQVRYPAFLQDGAQAVAWTVKEIARFGGDPGRLFLMGHSAGAYNAAMLALDERWLAEQGLHTSVVRGWIGLAGPYDFIPIVEPDVRPVFFYPDTPADSQPINHVSRTAPPTLLLAARDDTLVNPERNTGGLARKLRANGVAVTEQYYSHVGHASLIATLSTPLRGLAPALDAIVQFIDATASRPVR